MTFLRPLKTSELRDIFRTLDRGGKGALDCSDLQRAYALLGSKAALGPEDAGYVLEHLVQVGASSFNSLGNSTSTPPGSNNALSWSPSQPGHGSDPGGSADDGLPKLDLTTFVDAVNHVLSTNSLEQLLKSTFEAVSSARSTSSSSNRVVTVSQLLELARAFGLKLSKDSEVRIQARVPNGAVDFAEFVELVAST
ncbi:uncharacterized protein TOT_010000524 [Theileria orientalis strain Shintoku]|uniref:EF-hand domain-containing protein n=1 Tax=Theileria orientalis strain Shintoku TaxID=869250 RepID=J4C2P7_THEOR|nr:uncharacterized protein TOT_010000524 [Theileria orientalis strain Shintoku]BAM39061.1 uncharacterized protein TOT_010000524 [Theileria orientalis strain Shintoku]|eukprot:XP_009689362.1 uncharacterized protein TOT_010000524 [Theileria orientalis strain Shintoku]